MKLNKPYRLSALLFSSLIILLIVNSCKKEALIAKNTTESSLLTKAVISKNDKELILEARQFFETEASKVPKGAATQSQDGTPVIQSYDKSAFFNDAIVENMSVGKVVITPIDYQNKKIYAHSGIHFLDVSSYSALFVYQDTTGKRHAELVTKIPSQEFMEDSTANKKFSGIVTVTDWQGNYIRGYNFQKGIMVASLGAPEKIKKLKNINTLKKINQSVCSTIDYIIVAPAQQSSNVKVNGDYASVIFGSYQSCVEYGGISSSMYYGDYIAGSGGINSVAYPGSGSGDCGGAQGQSLSGGKVRLNGCNTNIALLQSLLDADPDFNNFYNRANKAEKVLFALSPYQALAAFSYSRTAETVANALYPEIGPNTPNGKQDAFRHAYWNALMDEGMGEGFAELFGSAHEQTDNPTADSQKSHQWDYWNNQAGRNLMESLKSNGNYPTTQDVIDGTNSLMTSGQLLIFDTPNNQLLPSNIP